VADEEGIIVVPRARAEDVLAKPQAKLTADSALDLDARERRHRCAVESGLRSRGYRL